MREPLGNSPTSTTPLPLHVVLLAASEEASSGRLRRTLRQAAQQVAAGQDIGGLLQEFRSRLPQELVTAIDVGLQAGDVQAAIRNALNELVQQRRVRDAVAPLLWYAVPVLIAAGLVVWFLVAHVLRDFKRIFSDFGIQLPALTKGMIALSDLLVHYGPLLLALPIALLIVWPLLKKWPTAAGLLDWLLLRLPVIGAVREATCLSRFCRRLAFLLRQQWPLPQALRRTAAALPGHPLLGQECHRMADAIEKGAALQQAAGSRLPSEIRHAMQRCQEPKPLGDVLDAMADLYARQARLRAWTASVTMGPCFIVLLGFLVLLVVSSLFLPLAELLHELSG